MSDLILPSMVTVMAHKRLRESAAALRNKLTATVYDVRRPFLASGSTLAVRKSRVEYDMLALIDGGSKLLAGHSPATVPPGLDIGGTGEFAILGSSAYVWGDYAAHFTDDPLGRAGAMRRGSFDPNYSSVSVPSTQFAIRLGELARSKTNNATHIAQIDAFVAGMLSSVAHDFVVGSVTRGVRADVSFNRHSRHLIPGMSRATGQAFDSLFGGPRGAGTWQAWWPTESDVPDAIYEGYVAAASEVYGFLTEDPMPGFASFLEDFEAPPELTEDRLRAGVSFLTQDVVTSSWGAGMWYLLFLPAILSVPVSLLVGRYLEPANGFFAENPDSSAMGGLQLYSLASGISALTPFILSMHVWTQVPEHGRAFISALVTGIVRLITTPLTMGFAAGDLEGGAWTSMAFHIGTDLYSMISGFVDLGLGNSADAFLELFNSMPFVFGLIATGLGAAFEAMPQDEEYQFWLPWAGFTLALAGLGLIPAFLLADGDGIAGMFRPDSNPNLPVIASLEALAGGLVEADAATFDDTTLTYSTADPALSGLELLAGARHATDANRVVKLWWEGADDLTIEHDNNRIVLRQTDGTETTVVLGVHEADPAALVARLTGALADIQAEVVDTPDELDMAWPRSLKDPGDDEPSIAAHDLKATEPQPVGTTEDDAYLLHSAPRAVLATRTGVRPGAGQPTQAIPVAPASTTANDSALGLASELAAMLISGAVPSLRGATAVPSPPNPPLANPALRPIHQVFRNWNLDERRLNEWQAVVSGGAATEKANPADHDALMRPLDAASAPYANAVPTGNDLLNDMGWIPTWRAWLRMATDITSDATATSAERYTPLVARRDGSVASPTNQELSDAMRFLFDLR